MKTSRSAPLPALLAMAAMLAASTLAEAGLFRAYLSRGGNDANACTLAAPCRLLPAAIAAVNDGGEIWMIDSANYNSAPVAVDRSVTILAIPGAYASVVAINGPALEVAQNNARVVLRNLAIRQFTAGTSGVVLQAGDQLTVEDCEIYGLADRGILVGPGNPKLVVRNSVIRDSGNAGIEMGFAVNATLENVVVRGNSTGILVGGASRATISGSVIADNTVAGVSVEATSGGPARATVERSLIRGNATGLQASAAGGASTLVARTNSISGNDVGIGLVGGSATLEGNVVVQNRVGLALSGPGTPIAHTRENNTFFFNTDADIQGGAATPLAAR
jgi:hypothetical protein